MSQIDANTRSQVDRWNQTMLTIGTGAELAALPEYFAGMLVFCTVTGSGFTAGILYMRKETNDGWYEILDLTTAQVISGKTLSGASNTFTSIGTASIVDDAITVAKLANAITQFAIATASTAFTTTSTSYVDITSISVTITASGNKAGLITEYSSNEENSAAGNATTWAVTDGAGTVQTENKTDAQVADREVTILAGSYEAAPSAGSLTRKMQMKVSAGTGRMNNGAVVNGSAMYVMEII